MKPLVKAWTPSGWPVIEITCAGQVSAFSGEGAVAFYLDFVQALSDQHVAELLAFQKREIDALSATETSEQEAAGVVASGEPAEPPMCRCALCADYPRPDPRIDPKAFELAMSKAVSDYQRARMTK